MKKIISVLLALTMVMSLLPTVFAEGETETPVESVVKEYVLGSTGGNGVVELAKKTATAGFYEYKIGDVSYYLNTEYHKEYGNRGWRILGVNNEMIMKVVLGDSRIYRLFKDSTRNFIQAYVGYTTAAYTGKAPELDLAIALQAPEKKAFYIPVLAYGSGYNGNNESFYIDSLSAEKDRVEDYTVEKNKVTRSSSGRLDGAVYTASGDEIVVAAHHSEPGTRDYRYGKITLTEILDPTLSMTKSSYTFNIDDGDETNDSVANSVIIKGSILTNGATTPSNISMNVSDNYVTYKSSNENVVRVDADGTIRAIGKGTATISAETKDGAFKTADVPVTVNGKLEGRDYILTCESAFGTSSAVYLSTVNDYGKNGWKNFDIAEDIEANKQTHVAQVGTSANGLIFYLKTKSVNSHLSYALSLQTPEVAGFYVPKLVAYVNTGKSSAKSIKWYMSAPVDGKTKADDYFEDKNLVLETAPISYNSTQYATKAIYTTPGKELVSAMSSLRDDYKFFSITLVKLINPELKIQLESATLDVSSAPTTAASVTASGATQEKTSDDTITDIAVSENAITYKTNNEDVATVSENGTVTAVGAGEAKIWAESKDGLVKSNEVTVTVTEPATPEDDEALSDAFDAKEEKADTYVESTVTGLTEDATIEAEKNANGTFTLTAPETKENSKFLYWAKGMSANKKIVSFDNKLSGYMPEEDGKNYLIAVYEGDISDTAEYYNANGQRIATGAEPELPSMAGYGKATSWKKYGTTNIYVAEYNGKTQPDNVKVTVDGKEETVPYGTEIICTADSTKENFKCWTKSDINGKTEIVSAEKTYKFNAWEDCTVSAVYEEHTYAGAKMKIIIDTFTAGDVTAVMAEFIGLSNAVEKGIMYNGKKIAMTRPGNQFTVTAEDGGTFTGYAIVGNSASGYKLITDGTITVSEGK